jgi:hypothetical protein
MQRHGIALLKLITQHRDEKSGTKSRASLPSSQSFGSTYSLSREMEDLAVSPIQQPEAAAGGDARPNVRNDPYYLRLTMGRPVGRPMSRSTPTMAYGLQVNIATTYRYVLIIQILPIVVLFQTKKEITLRGSVTR